MIFELKKRVLPEEVDVFKVVHFSNYIRWSSAAMVECFVFYGLTDEVFNNGEVEIRIGKVQFIYSSSAKINDIVTVSFPKIELKEKSMVFSVRISVRGSSAVRGKITVAFVKAENGELTETPKEVKEAFDSYPSKTLSDRLVSIL